MTTRRKSTFDLKTNQLVRVYTPLGTRVARVLCSLCLMACTADLAGRSSQRTGRACERCGKPSTVVTL